MRVLLYLVVFFFSGSGVGQIQKNSKYLGSAWGLLLHRAFLFGVKVLYRSVVVAVLMAIAVTTFEPGSILSFYYWQLQETREVGGACSNPQFHRSSVVGAPVWVGGARPEAGSGSGARRGHSGPFCAFSCSLWMMGIKSSCSPRFYFPKLVTLISETTRTNEQWMSK